jgi:uncharacterized protein (DUF2147 family)
MKMSEKNIHNYKCENCDFKCCKKGDWSRHLATDKHIYRTIHIHLEQKSAEKDKEFTCKFCQKKYAARNSLWYHEKKCFIHSAKNSVQDDSSENNIQFQTLQQTDIKALTSVIFELVKTNTELQKNIYDICKQGQNNYTSNVNNINSNNKTFNLQVFLNETCKDAMNISDFIESVKLQVSDLENVGKVGYIEGISNIIIKNLQALEVEKRPVHCTDQKREVMYVKEDNIWEKEDEANKKLRKAIRSIAHKNICMLKAFREKYPDCEDYDSKKSSQYNKLVIEAMGGKGDNDYEKDTKIIKKIAKAVGIDKN